MKRLILILITLVIILSGCNNSKKTNIDLIEAENILRRTWKPINEMTNLNYETKPEIRISSKEEFFKIYDFSYMDKELVNRIIYSPLTEGFYAEEQSYGRKIKDNGDLVFNCGYYIPTIYDKGVYIKKAYIEKVEDEEILIILESSNKEIIENATGFGRKNIFRKNDKGEWILIDVDGVRSIRWKR